LVGTAVALGTLVLAEGAAARNASLPLTSGTAASRESVIHCFGCMPGGSKPSSRLMEDASGNFYGMADGGTYAQSFIYKLTQPSPSHPNGTFTPIYDFGPGGSAGFAVTAQGGIVINGDKGGIYELTPPAPGKTTWTDTLIYSTDTAPQLFARDANGIIYAMSYGGHCDDEVPQCAYIFTLIPPAAGQSLWTSKRLSGLYGLHAGDGDFLDDTIPDGSGGAYAIDSEVEGGGSSIVHMTAAGPTSLYPINISGIYSLALAPNGALYYSSLDYKNNSTQVFQLTPSRTGQTWTETLLYTFSSANVTLAAAKNDVLYVEVATKAKSSVVALTPPATGKTVWTAATLSTFDQGTAITSITLDPAGSFFGTSEAGALGYSPIAYSIFKLSPTESETGAWSRQTLHNFGGIDGGSPASSVLAGANGTLYETTRTGGNYDYGTVIQLVPPTHSNPKWDEHVLYSFGSLSDPTFPDGIIPNGPVIGDSAGAIYGTTFGGGAAKSGVVFKLSPPRAGETTWSETVLSNFSADDVDTAYQPPSSGLVMDSAGALYGTTLKGGTGRHGRVYKLTPPETGRASWTQTTLYEFDAKSSGPVNTMLRDASGNLYGTTIGNDGGYGSVFELSPPTSTGSYWHKTVLYSFTAATGKPVGGLTLGSGGALYVPTSSMFIRLTPPPVGHTVWTATTLYNFPSGSSPQAGLVLKDGNFYGVAAGPNNDGTVFKLHQSGPGHWAATSLYDFTGRADGALPDTNLTVGGDGALYGATYAGGGYSGGGVVFRIVP